MDNNSEYGKIHVKYDSYYSGSQLPSNTPGAIVRMNKTDKKGILLTSGIIGLCVLLFHYFGKLFVNIIIKTPIMDYYVSSDAIFNIVQIIYSAFCIMIPFGLGAIAIKLLNKKDGDRVLIPLDKPNSGKLVVLLLGVGFLALVVSNYITTFFVLGANAVGFEFETAESPAAKNVPAFLWQVLSTAIVPALMEEFAVRGVVMQSLRKYGDVFAIVSSAVIFALLHGNMVQAPFALMLGCVLGWAVIITDSLWTGIAIHFMNNFYATVMSTMMANCKESVYIATFIIVNGIGVVLGIIALIKIVDYYRHTSRLHSPGGFLPEGQRLYMAEAFFYEIISLPMMAALVVLIVDIVGRVSYVG